MTNDVTTALALLGIAGQSIAFAILMLGLCWIVGIRAPLTAIRSLIWGYELWLAFLVAAVSTGGSLFFSEVAHFVPCELCWFQRICMYPLSILMLFAAAFNDYRLARYLLPVALTGAGISVYQLLVENNVLAETRACLLSAPGGCATKWINEFGYVTIPTLALSGFATLIWLLAFATFGSEAQAKEGKQSRSNSPHRFEAVA